MHRITADREASWGGLTDSQILARAHAMGRFVLTHDSDFGTLALHRGESITGILYLRPGGRPPSEVIVDVQALMKAEIDWMPPVMAGVVCGYGSSQKRYDHCDA